MIFNLSGGGAGDSEAKIIVPIPTVSVGTYTYNGTAQGPTIGEYDSTKIIVRNATATNAGTYTLTLSLRNTAKMVWSDLTTADKTYNYTIGKKSLSVPTVSGSYTYDGTAKTASISAFDSTYITQGGTASATNYGTYTVTFGLNDTANTQWSDGTVVQKSANWSIAKKVLAVPTVSGSYTYNGSSQSATISTYDSNYITQGGTASATNADTYTVTFSLKDTTNTEWSGGGTSQKSGTWSIAKANQTITLSKTSVSLSASAMSDIVTVSLTGGGTLSVASADSSIATAALSNGVITISAVANGSTNVTVTASGTTNYNAKTETISASVSLVDPVLDNNDWATISSISAAGQASTYWNIGDVKKVTLNGTVGTLALSNVDLYVFIIGFDHNASVEGSGISFLGFKTAKTGGADVCLCDSNDGLTSNNGTKYFNLNHWGGSSSPYNTNYGGWKGCDARYDILGSTNLPPSGYGSTPTTSRVGYNAETSTTSSPVANTLMAALSSDLRAVMKPITKYTDNKGNSSNISANVTSSVDYLPLLSEYEVQGARTYANQYEKNSQAQYAYYANGNSKIKHKHNATGTAAYWWCRSAYYYTAYGFCSGGTDGTATGTDSRRSRGLAPMFLV